MIRAKDNPFRVSKIEALGYIPQTMPLEQIQQRLKQLNNTAEIVGPHGSGKTTLLRELEKHIGRGGVETQKLFMNLDTPLRWRMVRECIDSMNPGSILFFDGACHLSSLRFWQLRQKARKNNVGLVITSHEEGLLDTLAVCRPSVNLLTDITGRLLGEAAVPDPDDLSELYDMHSGNIRECLRDLYDHCELSANAADQR